MKKIAWVIALTSLVLAASTISFAQGPGQMEGQMGQQQQMGQGMKGGMMHGMMSGQMVATNDGGVIVMMGNKLYKYDKDLNLKKEVEIKMQKKEAPQQ